MYRVHNIPPTRIANISLSCKIVLHNIVDEIRSCTFPISSEVMLCIADHEEIVALITVTLAISFAKTTSGNISLLSFICVEVCKMEPLTLQVNPRGTSVPTQ